MSLSHLIRIGRHWLHPERIIRIEDMSRPGATASGVGDGLLIIVQAGEHIMLRGDDAIAMRRQLDAEVADAGLEDDPHPGGGSAGGPKVLSGHSTRPVVTRDNDVDGIREVSE